jgi:hypothetical protein
MTQFAMSFDPASMSEIAQFAGFQAYLSEEVQGAMTEAGQLLAEAAAARTWVVFANPSGRLAGSIMPVLDSPYEVQIGSDLPYARRREYGFSGKTDSLGRHYANDPGKPYFGPALEDNRQAVLQLLDKAVLAALQRMGGGY